MTEPHPLNTLELAQGAIEVPLEARFVSVVGGCQLLQFRVLGLGLLQDWDVGIGIFPKREEILIRGAGFGGIAVHGISSADLKMRECADARVEHKPTMVEDFLEFGRSLAALMRSEIGEAANVGRIKSNGCRSPCCVIGTKHGEYMTQKTAWVNTSSGVYHCPGTRWYPAGP